MSSAFKSGTSLLLALGITAGAAAPIVISAPAFAQTTFSDVSSNYWASTFVQELASRDVIKGFPDGTFRPNDPVTRAQFAAMISKAFNAQTTRSAVNFVDVPSDYWGFTAIQRAYTTGFLAGYPGNVFRPNENIPRAQVLVSLANGLNYASTTPADTTLQLFTDAADIPGYARGSIAAATERRIVVNYPDVQLLNSNRAATRAEVAAFIYQALVSTGQVAAIQSPYIVGQAPTPQPQAIRIPAGTAIPLQYKAEKILLAKNEPQPTPITMTVAQNIVTSDGTVLIPAGSQVAGQLVVSQGGAQFRSSELILASGQRLAIDATSDTITQTETVRKGANLGTILKDAALGSAAAAGISAVTGDRSIKAEEVLIGTGAGALAGLIFGGDRIDLISIRPDSDLNLKLNSELVLPR
ncbi:MAG: S-layer homology domain-containing protein [Leptolyngbyaceae cyanobacterium CSU_1_3]|nr:S-layer homology domain-containing protein [Leptolyngbyaceae cyanobacterium CSU_1_3]